MTKQERVHARKDWEKMDNTGRTIAAEAVPAVL